MHINKYLVMAAISASLRQHKWLRSKVCRKNIDTSSRTLNIFTPLQEYSKLALVDFTKKSWYSLTIWKSHLISTYKTNSSWQQNKDDRALKRHDRPIWPSPLPNIASSILQSSLLLYCCQLHFRTSEKWSTSTPESISKQCNDLRIL